jgi:PBSX family phage terminase large subunit
MLCGNCKTTNIQKPIDQHPSYLVCPNCNAIELTYEPQSYQEPAHHHPKNTSLKIVGFFGGYGSGKSKTSLQEIFLRSLENPKGTGLLTAPTLQQLKRTTLKTFFNEVCPPPLIKRYNKADGEIELENGFVFYTIPSDDEEKLRSINAGLIHMEEASGIKRSIYDQLLTRIRDPFVKHKYFAVCSNPDLGWIKEVFVDNEKRKNPKHPEHDDFNKHITTFIWETKLNTYLPPDFIEINSKGKPEWWVKRYLKGSFEHSEGMVYPNFGTTVVEPFEVPNTWERFVALDHGLRNPTAVPFGAIDPDTGIVYIYDEYYEPNRTVPEHAKHIKPKVESIPLGRLRFMVIDPSARNKSDPINGRSVQSLYAEYGLFFTEGNNAIEAGLLKVNSYINNGKLKVFNTCVSTIKEGLNYKFPEVTMDNEKNLDEKPLKRNDHMMDALRYALMRLPDDPDLLKTVGKEPPKRYNKVENDDFEEENDEKSDFLSYI